MQAKCNCSNKSIGITRKSLSGRPFQLSSLQELAEMLRIAPEGVKQDIKRAKSLYEMIVERDRNHIVAKRGLGEILLLGGINVPVQKELAQICFKEILKIDKNDWISLAYLGFIYEEKDPKKAQKYYQKAIDIAPEYPFALAHLAFLRVEDNPLDAEQLAERALRIQPENPIAKSVKAALLRTGKSRHGKHREEADRLFMQAKSKAPYDDHVAKLEKVPSYKSLNLNSLRAKELCAKALLDDPDDVLLQVQYASYFEGSARESKLLTAYAISPNHTTVLTELIEFYTQKNESNHQAFQYVQDLITVDFANSYGWQKLIKVACSLNTEELQKLYMKYQEAFKLEKKNIPALIFRAQLYIDREKSPSKALEILKFCKKLEKYNLAILNPLADLYKEQNQMELAKKTFERILKLDPDNLYAKEQFEKIFVTVMLEK